MSKKEFSSQLNWYLLFISQGKFMHILNHSRQTCSLYTVLQRFCLNTNTYPNEHIFLNVVAKIIPIVHVSHSSHLLPLSTSFPSPVYFSFSSHSPEGNIKICRHEISLDFSKKRKLRIK